MTLWNDLTHYLYDPAIGDQEQQDETRSTFGGTAAYAFRVVPGGSATETVVGLLRRYDTNSVDRRHTTGRATVLGTCRWPTRTSA